MTQWVLSTQEYVCCSRQTPRRRPRREKGNNKYAINQKEIEKNEEDTNGEEQKEEEKNEADTNGEKKSEEVKKEGEKTDEVNKEEEENEEDNKEEDKEEEALDKPCAFHAQVNAKEKEEEFESVSATDCYPRHEGKKKEEVEDRLCPKHSTALKKAEKVEDKKNV